MLYGDSNRCCCLFDCECDKVERLILDWTSQGALDKLKSRLFTFKDPTEIFARLACVLFYREILNGTPVICTKDSFKKADVAFRFAYTFANELDDCITFYSSCWRKFQDLVSRLEVGLNYFSLASRRVMQLQVLIEEMFPELDVSYSMAISAVETGTESVGADPIVRSTNEAADPQIISTDAPPQIKRELADVQNEPQLGDNQTPVTAVQKSTVVRKSSDDRACDDGQPRTKRAKLNITVERPDRSGDERNGEVDENSEENENTGSMDTKEVKQEPDLQQQPGNDEEEGDSGSVSRCWIYRCNIVNCGRRFKHDFLLQRHIRMHHGGTRCDFVCHECGYDCVSNQDLFGHKVVHDRSRMYDCRYCGYRYSLRFPRDTHEERCHANLHWQSSSNLKERLKQWDRQLRISSKSISDDCLSAKLHL